MHVPLCRTTPYTHTHTQEHIAEYGKQRLFTLVEVAAEFNKVKRGQKNEVLEAIEEAADATGRVF